MRIASDYKSILWGWWISLIFFLSSVVAFVFTLKINLYRFRFGTMVFVAISLILVLFFSWFNNYPFSLTHSQILDLSKDTDYSAELGSQCATKINIPSTLTPTLTFASTNTLIPTFTPVFTLTSTPTLPNYSLYIPRKEPANKKDFAFHDDFSSGDINDWSFSPETQDVSMQIVENALQVKLGRNYNGNHFLAGCTGEDCLIQPTYVGNLSYKFRLRAIQDSNNVQAGIAFGSSKILDDTNGYYLLLASNQGQIRFYSSFEILDLHNQTYKLYNIHPKGTVTLQIDFYKDCPNDAEQCALLFVNDTLITGTPLAITAPPYGYFGVFVLPGNTQGYIELITYEYIKAWYAP